MNIIDHFDMLTNNGIKVIPLYENSKIPLCKNWTIDWNKNILRQKLRKYPTSNIGILLGEIIDVEGDNEWANKLISNLIGNCEHVSYQSSKSTHHLFLNPDRTLRRFVWKGIEFRGWGHQSVLPPSQHHGTQYKWNHFLNFIIPEMPDRLLDFYKTKRYSKKILKKDHVAIQCNDCKKTRFLHRKRYLLELEILKIWTCRYCRVVDIRPDCRKLRKSIRKFNK